MSAPLPHFKCEAMSDDHSTLEFDCGYDSGLSGWLSEKALQYQQEHLARVWVLIDPSRPGVPVAYFTLSAHAIHVRGGVTKSDRRDNPANGNIAGALVQHPAHLLGKFAIDASYQGMGVGNVLMLHVYAKYLDSLDATASRYLVLHAREPALVEYYAQKFKFTRSPEGGSDSSVVMYKKTSSILEEMSNFRNKL